MSRLDFCLSGADNIEGDIYAKFAFKLLKTYGKEQFFTGSLHCWPDTVLKEV